MKLVSNQKEKKYLFITEINWSVVQLSLEAVLSFPRSAHNWQSFQETLIYINMCFIIILFPVWKEDDICRNTLMDIFSTVFITYITLLLNHLNKVSTKVSIYMFLHRLCFISRLRSFDRKWNCGSSTCQCGRVLPVKFVSWDQSIVRLTPDHQPCHNYCLHILFCI